MAVKPEIVDYINSHAEMVVSEAKQILGKITNKEVELEFKNVSEFEFENVNSNFSESVVGVDFKTENDPDGALFLFIDKMTAARIGSLMMMMEEENVEFAEEHIDAMKETANQILGSISTTLKSTDETAFSVTDLNCKEVELNAEMFDKPDLAVATFSLKIVDDEAKNVVSVMTASSIEGLLGSAEAEAAEETADAEKETEVADEEAVAAAEGEEGAEEGKGAEGEEESAGGDFDLSVMLDDDAEDMGDSVVEAPEVPVPSADRQEDTVDPKMAFLMNLTFPISIELGRTKMLIKDILDLGHGSVIEFEKLAGEPVDLLVEDKKIAEGEVVVVDEHFGIRITSLIHKEEVLKTLKSSHI